MKQVYNTETTLQTETRVRLEANYNRTIFGMTEPGDVLYYKAPSDPSEHPMYIDSDGRNIPVDPDTLQPMYNASGQAVDVNGTLLPVNSKGIRTHRDDVRIAVTASNFSVKDEKDEDVLVAPNGDIIPTDDNGQPGTVTIEGETWVVGSDGEPHSKLAQIYPLRAYKPPVRAENRPVNQAGTPQTVIADPQPEYFGIDHIVKADRPAKRGSLIAWTTADKTDEPVNTGIHGYDGARFYPATKDMTYQYWTSPVTSEATPTVVGTSLGVFDGTWRMVGGANRGTGNNLISGDFTSVPYKADTKYFEKVMNLQDSSGYEMAFDVLAQSPTIVKVSLIEWYDDQPAIPNYSSASKASHRVLTYRSVPAGATTRFTVDVTPSENTRSHAIRVSFHRLSSIALPKVTLTNLSLREVAYPINSVGPCALYDRPIMINKIVIGVDYSADETVDSQKSHSNMPAQTDIRILTDRGDGLFVWQDAVVNPTIDNDGKIVAYFADGAWGDEPDHESATPVMGVQYAVYSMKSKDARVNVMEISARRTYDVSELLMEYTIDSEASDQSFILPFGTVNSNIGSVTLSNHDGRFNSDNQFMLDTQRSDPDAPVFTNVPNPFFQMLNEAVHIEIDTATFVPGDEERDFIRMVTARSTEDIAPGSDMNAQISFADDSKYLEKIYPQSLFYSGENMSVIQVLYMLLDSVGFTNVVFSDEDQHFATHVNFFWVKGSDKNVWEIIADVCRATQTIAFFDEYNVLHFKSLRGMYEDALSKPPAQVLTAEDLPNIKSNIINNTVNSKDSVNRVTINYRETGLPEKTPSGITPMEVVWEPDGTQVLRSNYLVDNMNDLLPPTPGATRYISLPSGSTKTWPFSGMVQIEGEFVKYDGKQYKYHTSSGVAKYTVVKNEDERKELDKQNEFMQEKNLYTGLLRITERGAEGTTIRPHFKDELTSFNRRYRVGTGTTVQNFTQGLGIKNSRLFVIAPSSAQTSSRTTITTGHVNDYRPHHLGSRFRINAGGYAGVCFLMNSPNDDGVFVELATTQVIEGGGRARGELHVLVVKGGVPRYYGIGVPVPISTYKDYTLDVSVKDGAHVQFTRNYAEYYEVSLKYGDKGVYVRVLQAALNLHGEKLNADGVFGTKTRDAVVRLQRRKGLSQDGIVNIEEWQALESGNYNANMISIVATVDGTYTESVQIPKSELPTAAETGRWGVFTRSGTSASFEYMYAVRGPEEIDFDDTNFFDYVSGGYVSDALEARWIYNRKMRYVSGTSRNAINNQLKMIDFGAYAHEVRDYEVAFDHDSPAMASFLYFSNEAQVDVIDYEHGPFSAKFRLANKARHDAILNGEDSVTFGSENTVDQKMLIYGNTLKIDDERLISVSNETSVAARGVEEISIDVDWMQSRQAAEKLGSHIVSAMSDATTTLETTIFGHAALRVGQIVSVYDPQQGIGDPVDPENANRYFVHGVDQSNDGTQSTSVSLREVIGSGGLRSSRLSEVLAKNNNALNANPAIEDFEKVGFFYKPKGYIARSGVSMSFTAPTSPTLGGGGAAHLKGTGSTPILSTMYATPYVGEGRFAHNIGDYFIVAAEVTAATDVAVELAIEGYPTTGPMEKVLSSKAMVLKKGQTKTIVLKGRFLNDGNIPELLPVVRVLDPADTTQGAKALQAAKVNSFYYRSSQDEGSIYPLHGGEHLKKL